MIIWRRWGILALLIPFLLGFVAESQIDSEYSFPIEILIGGIISLLLGFKWNGNPNNISRKVKAHKRL